MDFAEVLKDEEKKRLQESDGTPKKANVANMLSLETKGKLESSKEPTSETKKNYRAPVDVTEEAFAYFRDAFLKNPKDESRKKQFKDFLQKNPSYMKYKSEFKNLD